MGDGQKFVCMSSSATVDHNLWPSECAGFLSDDNASSNLPKLLREVGQDPLTPFYRYHKTEISSSIGNLVNHPRKIYLQHTGYT